MLQFTRECGEEAPHLLRSTVSLTEAAPVYSSKMFRSSSGLQLRDAIGMELLCMEEMGIFMKSIPEQMCFLGKNSKDASSNTHCWTGTAVERYVSTPKLFLSVK